MWKALTAVAALGGVASADDSLLAGETRVARDAARSGHCEIAIEYGGKMAIDAPHYYQQTFLADPAIAACLAPPTDVAPTTNTAPPSLTMPAAVPPPPPRPRSGVPPVNGGTVVGQIFVGGLATIAGGLGGALVGYGIDTS